MELLFDDCVPRKLRQHFLPHQVTLTQEVGWKGLLNGSLLTRAQHSYDVLITTDTNLYHQNVVARFNIAVVVLRGYHNRYADLLPAIPDALTALQTIQAGEVTYVYADEKLRLSDRRKKKGPYR